MVQFNQSVKVLGYYLSDEERALKRQWSQENHERMVEVKRQIRRNKLLLHSSRLAQLQAPASPYSPPQKTFEMEPPAVFSAAIPVQPPMRPRTLAEDAVQLRLECEKVTSTFCAYLSAAITKAQQLTTLVEKDDTTALVCLRHLVIPEFPIE